MKERKIIETRDSSAQVCDYTVIQSDETSFIGDIQNKPYWETSFETGARDKDEIVVLMFMVKGLAHTEGAASVVINDRLVGRMRHYLDENFEHWYTQIMTFNGSYIREGINMIRINAVDVIKKLKTPKDPYDDFKIREMIIYFKQGA